MKNALNNIAVAVGVVDGTTHIEVKVSLNKADSSYTVWKTVNKIKHTYTFMGIPITSLAGAMAVFDEELEKLKYTLSVCERSIIEMRLRNEAGDDMDVVCFGEAYPNTVTYDNSGYAEAVELGWNVGVSCTGEDHIAYRELDSFATQGDRVVRLLQLRHPEYPGERLLIRNALMNNEPTVVETIAAIENTPEIFAVAYKDKAVGWEKYMRAKLTYTHRENPLTREPMTNLPSYSEMQTKEQQAQALQFLVVHLLEQSGLLPEYWDALSYAKKALAAFPK